MPILGPSQQYLFRLKTSIQEYPWGKQGSESLVAQYGPAAVGDGFKVDEGKMYAEIWMGTHSNGPSSLWSSTSLPISTPSKSLHSLVSSNPTQYLGTSITQKFPNSTQIPYLFKILSIAKALPLQAHPDKALGEKLNKKDKEQFVDANHKPEIAVALKDGFRGFVGFRTLERIRLSLEGVKELREAVGNDDIVEKFVEEPTKESLKELFTSMFMRDQKDVKDVVEKLLKRVKREGIEALRSEGENAQEMTEVVMRLEDQYPGDVGVLACPFFMNLITLNRGEAVYIGADEAHAYLEGDIIECMAVSDNVLNAAFVPPSTRNTSTFLQALTYTARPSSHWLLPHQAYENSKLGKTVKFDPPLEEFIVLATDLFDGKGGMREELEAVDGPTIGIVTEGEVGIRILEGPGKGESLGLGRGGVAFVAPGNKIQVESQGGDGAEVRWATCRA